MHLSGRVLFLFFLPVGACRSIRIDDSGDDAQQQDDTLINRFQVSAEAREAYIPGGFGTRISRRAGPQAGAWREGSKQDGRRVAHLEPDRGAPLFLFGPGRTKVALQAASGPEESLLPPKRAEAWDYERVGRRAVHLASHRGAPLFRYGPRRAKVALQAASSPEPGIQSGVKLPDASLDYGCLPLNALASPTTTSDASVHDLLVIGAGTLGARVCRQWRALFPGARVVGLTSGEARHEALRAAGITPRLLSTLEGGAEEGRWPYVVFCAPPGKNEAYVADVAAAARFWQGGDVGNFVFTSSGGVFAEDGGGTVTEASAVGDAPRLARLLGAEAVTREAGGSVVRLAGLYTLSRGAHNYYLTQSAVAQRADSIINLLHYSDAAGCVVAALLRGRAEGGALYIAADNDPLTRQQICNAALQNAQYAGAAAPAFTATEGGRGKVYNTTATRRALDWQPLYPSFRDYMASSASRDDD